MAGNNNNLIPPTKGEIRNPKGKPLGTVHLSTKIKKILEEDLDWSKVPIKNGKELQDRYGKDGWKAIIYVALGQAISGNKEAREWLSKTSYGTQIDITSKGESIAPKIVSVIQPNKTKELGETV